MDAHSSANDAMFNFIMILFLYFFSIAGIFGFRRSDDVNVKMFLESVMKENRLEDASYLPQSGIKETFF